MAVRLEKHEIVEFVAKNHPESLDVVDKVCDVTKRITTSVPFDGISSRTTRLQYVPVLIMRTMVLLLC